MLLRLINKVLQRFGYVMLQKELLNETVMLTVAYLAALQKTLKENECIVYDRERCVAEIVTRH